MIKNVALAALVVSVLAACGKSSLNTMGDDIPDGSGPPDVRDGPCNLLMQSGCATGERCTWFHDDARQPPLGHIECAPIGQAPAQLGAACTYGAAGATGFDNCERGAVCTGGICKAICDQNGGTPMCANDFACATHPGLFGNGQNPVAAGVCDPSCDPLTQQTSTGVPLCGGGSGSDGVAVNGCYGNFYKVAEHKWSCAANLDPTLTHRMACTTATGCAPSTMNVYVNGCAAGNLPIIFDTTSETMEDCGYICKPAPHYLGANGSARGIAPNDCSAANHAPGANEECIYEWLFEEISSGGTFTVPDTSGNTYGVCHDPTKASGELMDNRGNPVAWPSCSQLPNGSGGSNGSDAVNWGCVPFPTLLTGSISHSKLHGDVRLPYGKLDRR